MLVNSHTAGKSALVNLVLNNLPTGFTAAICETPNAPFTTPNGTKWMRVNVVNTSVLNVTQGGYQRTKGILTVDLFYPKNTGDLAANTATDQLIQALSNSENEFVKVFEASPSARIDGQWYHVQIDFNFTYEGLSNA